MSENGATWIGAKCYTLGREDTVQMLVLHWMATNLAGADATFTGGVRQASAHFGLEDGKRHQYVHKADTAWHAGVRAINHKSIGIEHSAQPGRDASEATILDSIALCTDLCREFNLTADDIHQHSDYYATQCPGTLPVSRIREAVRANLASPAAPPEVPDMTEADLIDLLHKAADPNYPTAAGTAEGRQLRNYLQAIVAPAVKAPTVPAPTIDYTALAKAIVLEILGKA